MPRLVSRAVGETAIEIDVDDAVDIRAAGQLGQKYCLQ